MTHQEKNTRLKTAGLVLIIGKPPDGSITPMERWKVLKLLCRINLNFSLQLFFCMKKTYWKTTWAVLNSTAYRMHGLTVYIVKRMYWCVMMFKRRVDSVWYCADSCAVLRTDLITLHRKNCTAYLKLYKPSCKLKCKLIIIKFVCLHVGLFSKN